MFGREKELNIFMQQANYSLMEAEHHCSVQKQAVVIYSFVPAPFHPRKPVAKLVRILGWPATAMCFNEVTRSQRHANDAR